MISTNNQKNQKKETEEQAISWKQDRLYTSQPYFVLDTSDFSQKIVISNGISHFYSFTMKKGQIMRLVPDGCIDLLFGYDLQTGEMRARAAGTVLQYTEQTMPYSEQIFGIRLMPGMQTDLLTVTTKSLVGKEVPLEEVFSGDLDGLKEMADADNFHQRADIFLNYYMEKQKSREVPAFGKAAMIQAVKKKVYDTDGRIRIHQLEEETGYTERYINKVFLAEMGFSPKTFCKIIQFQRALKYLNYGAPEKMTDAAVMLGYYDQPQFIRNFSRFAGTTPMRYLRQVKESHYPERILDAENPGISDPVHAIR